MEGHRSTLHAFGSAFMGQSILFKKVVDEKFVEQKTSYQMSGTNEFFRGFFSGSLGLLKRYIAFYLPPNIWVHFKVFGVLVLMLVSWVN